MHSKCLQTVTEGGMETGGDSNRKIRTCQYNKRFVASCGTSRRAVKENKEIAR